MHNEPSEIHVKHGMKAPSSVALLLLGVVLFLIGVFVGPRTVSASGADIPATVHSVRVLTGKKTKGTMSVTVYIAPGDGQAKGLVVGDKIVIRR